MISPENNELLLANLSKKVKELEEKVGHTDDSLNDYFRCVASILIWFMQCGFAFLEAGAVRSKNVTNILIKNMMDSFVGGIAYYLFGYALAFGEPGSFFCGTRYWALHNLSSSNYSHVFLNYVFASTSATIVSGAVAERCEFAAYMIYTVLIAGFAYPIATHWAWTESGWLHKGMRNISFWDGSVDNAGFRDYAGSGVVHLLGGTSAFVAAFILKPRLHRFDAATREPRDIRGHSVPVVCLGAFILFFGFFAFNGGSRKHITNKDDGVIVATAMLNTCISGCVAAFTTLVVMRLHSKTWSLLCTVNGALAGMVGICAGCNEYEPWGAVIVGSLAPFFYLAVARIVLALRVDDPLEAVGVHFGGGLLGLLMVPFLSTNGGMVFNASPQGGMNLLWQLIGACAISGWSAATSFIIFGILQLLGMFRVPAEIEEKGLDIPKHGEPAYPLMAYGHGWGEKIPELSFAGMEVFSQRRRQKISKRVGTALQNHHVMPSTRERDRLFNDMNLPEVGAAIRTIGDGGGGGGGGGTSSSTGKESSCSSAQSHSDSGVKF